MSIFLFSVHLRPTGVARIQRGELRALLCHDGRQGLYVFVFADQLLSPFTAVTAPCVFLGKNHLKSVRDRFFAAVKRLRQKVKATKIQAKN